MKRIIVTALFGMVAAVSGCDRFWSSAPAGVWVDVVFLVSTAACVALLVGSLLGRMRRIHSDETDHLDS